MKIQLDTKNKTIKVEENINLKELVDFLDKILPKEWQKFTLETQTIINNWNNPIYIEKQVPYYPNPIWTCQNNDNKMYCLNKGTYNLELN